LATDGLVAERNKESPLMWRIFIFDKKSYIADTPGHVEYTRNMVTGLRLQVSIILIDARKGVIEQTYRHFFINLLSVKEIVAINKWI
jgi:sulfate adenylyltransferase subunit 1